MDELFKKVLSIAGYLFASLLLVFTSIQTYGLLYEVSGNHLTAAIGLIVFEGGLIYWWSVFRREAEGLFQMAISALMFLVGLALVTTAVALHLGAVDASFMGAETPARIIIIAVLLNLIAKLVYPLVHPDTFTRVTERAHEGKILAGTYKKFETKIGDITDETSNDMAELWKERTRARIMENWQGSLNKRLPDGSSALVEKTPAHSANGSRPTNSPDGH